MQVPGAPPPTIDTYNLASFWGSDRLPKPQEQADAVVLYVGDDKLSSPEAFSLVPSDLLAGWIGTALSGPDHLQGLHWILQYLAQSKLVESSAKGRTGDMVNHLRLTMDGWNRYDVLTTKRSNSRTAFMAMKFGDAELDQVYADCFVPAVAHTGFELRRLIDGQGAGLIDNQLRAALLGARFVVADLSHGNQGAYWEAGFAEGLDLPVIYTCKKARWDSEKTHFDTNHMKTIIWDAESLTDAAKELTATIRATLRAEAKQIDD
jgi:hypothetical protein